MAILLAALAPRAVGAQAPDGERCERRAAEAAYTAGMDRYGRRQWAEAIPHLEEAVERCPVPDGDWRVQVHVFLQYPYLPFYFLGKCHYNLGDLHAALRQLTLSGCLGGGSLDAEQEEDVERTTADCRVRLRRVRRAGFVPFSEGLAARERDWQEAAEKMWDALLEKEETGEIKQPQGRWPAPYLPRFHLAEALFHLGCYDQALEQMDASLLNRLGGGEVEVERKRMEELRSEREARVREGDEKPAICGWWRCWLQGGEP